MDLSRKIGIGVVMVVPTFVGSGAGWGIFSSYIAVFVWVVIMAFLYGGILSGKILSTQIFLFHSALKSKVSTPHLIVSRIIPKRNPFSNTWFIVSGVSWSRVKFDKKVMFLGTNLTSNLPLHISSHIEDLPYIGKLFSDLQP